MKNSTGVGDRNAFVRVEQLLMDASYNQASLRAARSTTLGFSDKAKLDEGHMWPTAFALNELTAAEEAKIGALVKKAVS